MPRFAASHLGLFCLPMSHKKDARLIWVKYFNQNRACYNVCVIIENRQIIRPRQCSQLTLVQFTRISEDLFFKVVLDVAHPPGV